jgi:hypothetical protein
LGKLGLSDEEQIRVATEYRAAIFTHDVDFLRIASQGDHPGIIYVHQQKLNIGECIKRLKALAEAKFPPEMRNRMIFL